MEFRLLYEGELLSSTASKGRPEEKHKIRRIFHPQLRRLWQIDRNLRELAHHWKGILPEFEPNPNRYGRTVTEQDWVDSGLKSIGKFWNRAGYNFVPLVAPEFLLRCNLEILLLRPGEKKYIFEMGDIDGQLKTLFDSLKMPKNRGETGDSSPGNDEDPFFCLLENDNLITEVHVVTDSLLLLPNHKEIKANDAFVVIDVKLNHKNAGAFDNYFG